ncbi:hypothetical protein AMTRI_Chr10g1080 [Amborella trichopoda]|uniref:WEB family protein n=1 Tax=Amborella trichopoda TaxID=13333 RepID=W1PFY1_AMBTC|nr:protein WEAK CHLOROPLAST MOVEMENT UNDER BLUE LIGHT 1 [Amborella trichopoda]XP_020523288.1 protein WEAK CHLOROPLAST MOVEMENT UNDER BLUE LIGHT 1 [Amborella trichopoda]XP_020523289.1 protein WEAK CHLOROPLAST MOVEMENT UNDER BLUE LIGHT 1 [Amborella trichopoda]ERN06546.1 hypothetical protein AMTR_s00058p00115380 [Amborella trichopoda]|eukprot:XP_020523287.1 protein WEAK CHLOROPLAST MOVEMENT UNDER BLUE LIGHT 1 [Amborella trichopoda]
MGEIDTKSIEPVQVALSLFGEKSEQRKYRSVGSEETEKKEYNVIHKELANYKVQLEIKESANVQVLRKLESCEKTIEGLSIRLHKTECDRDRYIEECETLKTHIDKLESENKELRDSQLELLNLRQELSVAEKSKLKAMEQAEEMATTLDLEREKVEELLKHISELNQALLFAKLEAIEAEKEKSALLSEKEEEVDKARVMAEQACKELEDMRKQLDASKGLEKQLLASSLAIDSLRDELQKARELQNSSAKAASTAVDELNKLKQEMDIIRKADSDITDSIESLEALLNQSKEELKNAKEEVHELKNCILVTHNEMGKVRNEMAAMVKRESEAQIECALMKAELHKMKSKVAASEAAEAKARSATSGLYLAVQQLAMEAEEAKKEAQKLKEANKAGKIIERANKSIHSPQNEKLSPSSITETAGSSEARGIIELSIKSEELTKSSCSGITISIEEYESLIRKSEKSDINTYPRDDDTLHQLEAMREREFEILNKLEEANKEISKLKSTVDDTMKRAEMAEKAKAAVEDQLRKWREQRQRRRAASSKDLSSGNGKTPSPPVYDTPMHYETLGKVLNIKI